MIRAMGQNNTIFAGFTLVELMVVIAISGIAMTGLLVAYTDGIDYLSDMAQVSILYDEGSAALVRIGMAIREANRITIRSNAGVRDARIDLRYPEDSGGGTVSIYFNELDKSVKWNNHRYGGNKFGIKMLPLFQYRSENDDDRYLKVKRLQFTPLDFIGPINPQTEGYYLVMTELILEDARGDTLYLSSVVSKWNKE